MKKILFGLLALTILSGDCSVYAQGWQSINCPDGLDNRVEVQFRAKSSLTFDGIDGSKDNLHYAFRITNHYPEAQKVWIILTTKQGTKERTSNNGPVTLQPERPFADSSSVDAYGSAVLGCRVTFKAPGRPGVSQGALGTPVAPGVNVIEFPAPKSKPSTKRKRPKPKS
jgi:hypothetical protein